MMIMINIIDETGNPVCTEYIKWNDKLDKPKHIPVLLVTSYIISPLYHRYSWVFQFVSG